MINRFPGFKDFHLWTRKELIKLTTFTLYEGMGHAYLDFIGVYPQAENCIHDIGDFIKKNKR